MALQPLAIDADSPHGDFCVVGYRSVGHDRNSERLDIQSIGEMQRIDDFRDLQDEAQTLAAMFPILETGATKAKESDTAREKLGMIFRLLTFREVYVDAKDGCIMRAANIVQIQKNSVWGRALRS